jgi:carnitine O-acetyltransferase
MLKVILLTKMPSATSSVRTFTMPKSLNESLAQPGQSQPASDTGRSLDGAKKVTDQYSKSQKDPLAASQPPKLKQGITFAAQDRLPKLPIPDLEGTAAKYLAALKPLQTPREHAETNQAVEEFLKSEGPELQERLKKYATGKTSYIEQFCKSSVLKLDHY